MKKMMCCLVLVVALCVGGNAVACCNKRVGRFVPCDYNQASFFFWIDTTCAKIWRVQMLGKNMMEWQYVGRVPNAKRGEIGTYIPYRNKSGGGLFILDTVTGKGWFFNGGPNIRELIIPLGLPRNN